MNKSIKTPQAFVYVAKIPASKKIKNIVFRHGEPVVVWDPKLIRLLHRLAYVKAADMPAVGEAAKPKKQPEVKPVAAPANDEKEALRAELDRLSIGYDKRWGVKALKEQLALATGTQQAPPEMAEAV